MKNEAESDTALPVTFCHANVVPPQPVHKPDFHPPRAYEGYRLPTGRRGNEAMESLSEKNPRRLERRASFRQRPRPIKGNFFITLRSMISPRSSPAGPRGQPLFHG